MEKQAGFSLRNSKEDFMRTSHLTVAAPALAKSSIYDNAFWQSIVIH